MVVHVKEINVQNLGPVDRFSMKLGLFNLIFGRNERGKTYLVEFLIRSLFRSSRQWKLRDIKGSGKVGVEGLRERRVDFSPSSSVKMEDFWEKGSVGLPPDFSRLLVVKGAETELADREGGVDRAILKRYLSSQEILDSIDQRISKTIQETEINNRILVGSKRGEIKERERLGETLDELDQLFVQIDKMYSGGYRRILTDEKDKLEIQSELLDKAKRYLAFSLSREIKTLERERRRISDEHLQEARETLRLYKQKIEDYKQKKREQKEVENRSQHHEWLASASDVYESIMNREVGKPGLILPVLSFLLIVSAGVFAFLGMPVGVAGSLAGVVLLGVLYFRKLHSATRQVSEGEELKKIEAEFKIRFGEDLTGLALIREHVHKTEEDYSKARLLKDQLYADLRNIESLKLKISDQIVDLTGEKREPEVWEKTLKELVERLRELDEHYQERNIRLARLQVDPSDYVEEKPEVEFSQQNYEAIQERLGKIDRQIEEENLKLENLKRSIYRLTKDEEAHNWETLIQNLRKKREEIAGEYKQKTAEILGKIIVHRVLQDLQKDEDTKIVEGLQTKSVLDPIYKITRKYKSINLAGNELIVSDQFHDFPLSELSKGAQEQVLLALRIGFSTQLMKKDSLFLILDDAFQYSDWERRVWLMDIVVNLAQNGWQIIYFTMDDHIKKLFDSKGKVFGDEYKHSTLDSQS